jgi:DNA uptake protein ComE-like DNA-binding protein
MNQVRPPSRHRWWGLMPAYTFGFLGFVPILHAAITLRRRNLWISAVAYFVAAAVGGALVNSSPADGSGAGGTFGSLIMIGTATFGTIQAMQLRDEVFGHQTQQRSAAPISVTDPAVQLALQGRARRTEARALARKDPALARELRIGRPDLPRQYDDGGLVDINTATPAVLCKHLGLSDADARLVVEARTALGHYESPEDLVAMSQLPTRTFDAIKDWVIVL